MRFALPLLLLPLAAPATAQIWDGGRSAVRAPSAPETAWIGDDLYAIDRLIRDGRRSGQLTRAEARMLRAESAMIGRLARQYRRGGPIAMNAPTLATRTLALRGLVNAARTRTK